MVIVISNRNAKSNV